MANAKKCDRCGKFYDKNLKYRGRNHTDEFRNGMAYTTNYENCCSYFDLCDECLTKLDKFLGGMRLADEKQ